MKQQDIIIELENTNRTYTFIIAALFLAVCLLLFIVYRVGTNTQEDNTTQACVPKMQGTYTNMEENFMVAVINTKTPTGQELAGQLQNAINQMNKLQVGK